MPEETALVESSLFPAFQTNTQRCYFAIRGRDAAAGRVLEFNLKLIIVIWPIRERTFIDHTATTSCERHFSRN